MEKEIRHRKLVEAVTEIAHYKIRSIDEFGDNGPKIDKDLIGEVVSTIKDDGVLEFIARKYIARRLEYYAKGYNEYLKEKGGKNESI